MAAWGDSFCNACGVYWNRRDGVGCWRCGSEKFVAYLGYTPARLGVIDAMNRITTLVLDQSEQAV